MEERSKPAAEAPVSKALAEAPAQPAAQAAQDTPTEQKNISTAQPEAKSGSAEKQTETKSVSQEDKNILEHIKALTLKLNDNSILSKLTKAVQFNQVEQQSTKKNAAPESKQEEK